MSLDGFGFCSLHGIRYGRASLFWCCICILRPTADHSDADAPTSRSYNYYRATLC